LHEVRARTVVLVGSRDDEGNRAISARVAAEVVGARLEIVEGAGHLVQLEDPGRVVACLAAPILRAAKIEDADAIAALHVEAWRWAYRDLLPEVLLAGLSEERRATMWRNAIGEGKGHIVVAADGEALVGFVAAGPERDGPGGADVGEIYALYLRQDAAGTGLGRALIDGAIEALAHRGARAVVLWVLEGNTRARRFYERVGFRADGETKIESRDDGDLHELRYALDLAREG
jgi:ribosomal protein S18 acetylase RimI-like enzyme